MYVQPTDQHFPDSGAGRLWSLPWSPFSTSPSLVCATSQPLLRLRNLLAAFSSCPTIRRNSYVPDCVPVRFPPIHLERVNPPPQPGHLTRTMLSRGNKLETNLQASHFHLSVRRLSHAAEIAVRSHAPLCMIATQGSFCLRLLPTPLVSRRAACSSSSSRFCCRWGGC
jgi:hypothetical protein